MVGNEALLCAFDLLLEMWKEEHPEIPAWKIPALILERNLRDGYVSNNREPHRVELETYLIVAC